MDGFVPQTHLPSQDFAFNAPLLAALPVDEFDIALTASIDHEVGREGFID